jgi:streptogramin lyase
LEDRLCLSTDLLVSSYGNDSVMRYNGTTGAFLGAFVIPGYGDLYGPHGLLIGLDGNLLVASTESHAVLRYNSTTGAFMGAFVPTGSGGLYRDHGVVFGPDGNLYVSSPGSQSVLRYNGTTGAFMGAFVPSGSGGLTDPTGIVFGPDGNLYVNSILNSSVMRYDGTTGAPLPAPGQGGAFFVTPGSGGLVFPSMAITFGPDGNLYVGGYLSHNVVRYDGTTGAFIDTFVSAGSGGLSQTQGLAFGPDGNLYVCSNANSRVLRYDGGTGSFMDAFVPPGGPLNAPTYLFFWDTGGNSPIGHGGATSHHVTTSAAHGSGLADADPGVVLPAAYPFTAADQGTHTFSGGFTLLTPGTWTLTATDAAGGFSTSVPITVTSGGGGGGGQSPNALRPRYDLAAVDRLFAARTEELGWLGLPGTAGQGEDGALWNGPSGMACADLATVIAHNHAATSHDDYFGG